MLRLVCTGQTLFLTNFIQPPCINFAVVSEAWNKTIKCPAKKAGQFTQVYIGNVNLIQALHIHLAMSCQDPAPRTKGIFNLKFILVLVFSSSHTLKYCCLIKKNF